MDNRSTLIVIVVGCAMIAIGLGVGLAIGLRNSNEPTEEPPNSSEKSVGENYRFASVTADNGQCSTVGVEIMATKGGSAVDGAVATLLCLGVINAQSTGLGGGALMTIYETPRNGSQKEWKSLVARETAPTWAHKDLFINMPDAQGTGVWSIMPPGDLNGYYEAWQRYGRVEWKELFQPAIDIATHGWKVSEHMETGISGSLTAIRKDPGLSEQYLKADGSPYKAGDAMTDPKLAATLQKVANDPTYIESFYKGSLAQDIVQDIQNAGGNISVQDLESNEVQWNDPVQVTLKNGYRTFGTYLPSSSVLVGFILKIMEGYEPTPEDLKDNKKKALLLHRLAESFKMALARRPLFVGDPDYVDSVLITKWLDDLNDDAYVDQVRAAIKDDGVLTDYSPDASAMTSPKLELPGGTTHLNAVSPEGGFVGITSTVGSFFGSKVRGVKTGIVFGNLFNLFDHRSTMEQDPTNTVNHIAAGKRPRSSTGCVMLVKDNNEPVLTIGASGGPRIITATAQVLMHTLWNGLNVTDAVDEARVYASHGSPNKLYHDAMPQDILDELRAKGHVEQEAVPGDTFGYLAVVQAVDIRSCDSLGAITRDSYCKQGVSDHRKQGLPDGY